MKKFYRAIFALALSVLSWIASSQTNQLPQTSSQIVQSGMSTKAFAPLISLKFGAAIGHSGCTVRMISTQETCVQKMPAAFTDQAWAPEANGTYSLRNAAFSFVGLRILGDFPVGKNGREVKIELEQGRLISVEMSKSRAEVDVARLESSLTSYFGEPELTKRQAPELFVSKERRDGTKPMVTVTTKRWKAEDALVEFECYEGLCIVRGTSKRN